MTIKFAHLRELSTTGVYVDFAVFHANATNGSDIERAEILEDLTTRARLGMRLKIDASALVFTEGGRTRTYGDHFVIDYLSKRGVPRPTHYIDV